MTDHNQLEPAALVSGARGRIGLEDFGPPSQLQVELSKAISLKRIADAICGDEQNSGIRHAIFDIAERGRLRREGKWGLIETAPKDGSHIIAGRFGTSLELIWVMHSRWITVGEIAEVEGGSPDEYDAGWTHGNDENEPCYPTHWMPLPEPPKATK